MPGEEQEEQIGDMLEDGPEEEEEVKEQDNSEESPAEQSDNDDNESSDELSEVEKKDARINALKERLNESTNQKEDKSSAEEKETEPEPDDEDDDFEPITDVTEDTKDVSVRLVDEGDMDDIWDNPEKLNNILNKVLKISIANSRKTREQVLREVPKIASKQASQATTLRTAVNEFYKKNPDLKEYEGFVGHVANDIQNKNPEMKLEEIFEETEEQVREELKLRKESGSDSSQNRESTDSSKFPETPGARRGSSDNRSDQQKQIDDLINSR